MSRLLTIVNERKKLRNEYRRHLEDEYIAKKKQEEQAAIKAENEKLGVKGAPTPEELKEILKARTAKKHEEMNKSFEALKQKYEKEETATSPLLNEADLKLISQT